MTHKKFIPHIPCSVKPTLLILEIHSSDKFCGPFAPIAHSREKAVTSLYPAREFLMLF